ncbi:MAG: YgjV family protein [Aliivibrio sp.]|uniref:YgjV family protein n=1 Tax=Aliivibrio sp. TaxID=1872443 RepID=UPI001A402F0C|nr:YgjV family protein [Aliivibrio sp.]
MDYSVVGQGLGLLSFALGVLSFKQKNDRKLKIMMMIFNLNHMLHFILLGSVSSAFGSFISIIRTGTSLYTSSKYVALAFIVLAVSLGSLTINSIWDCLPIVGVSIGTYALFVLRGIQMRVCLLFGSLVWLMNNIIVGSIGGVMLESTVIVFNLRTIYHLNCSRKAAAMN